MNAFGNSKSVISSRVCEQFFDNNARVYVQRFLPGKTEIHTCWKLDIVIGIDFSYAHYLIVSCRVKWIRGSVTELLCNKCSAKLKSSYRNKSISRFSSSSSALKGTKHGVIVIRASLYHNTEGNYEYVNITLERNKVSYIFLNAVCRYARLLFRIRFNICLAAPPCRRIYHSSKYLLFTLRFSFKCKGLFGRPTVCSRTHDYDVD